MKLPFGLLAAALLLTGSASAQKLKAAQVPAAVVAGFNQKFPQAKEVKWEKEGSHYEAGFEQGKQEMSALLSAAGTLVETETEIQVSQLPAGVQATLARQYKGVKIKEAAKIVAAGTGTVTYEAEIEQGGKEVDLLFDAEGREVKK
ncbi:PepSY-like domain-containing protein [Hymenobacter actinosclerus]|uniref:Putative beta-lactamase-inhibitor-like, PepSY-like n=1 Tax=Hymenobacter actinosclerus TaxID=82805 RepID=A0A1I0BRI5_9BACT|nr:PepSY-like domain-containing protein [Hymenobacter actinosclerus]SET09689.1 Putative beta-lactamase-inhibitor-like, PepSY-like [Hymenobacter actinosclerus]